MASIGKLVAAIAEAEGLEEASVKLMARYAREAGHISQGSFGPGAAQMTARDAANLLIAVNGTGLAKDTAVTIERFRNLEAAGAVASILERNSLASAICSPGARFGNILEVIIDGCMSGELQEMLDEAEHPDLKSENVPGLNLAAAQMEIEFHRPFPKAAIVVYRPAPRKIGDQTWAVRSEVFRSFFYSSVYTIDQSKAAGDQRVVTTISEATIISAADIIRK